MSDKDVQGEVKESCCNEWRRAHEWGTDNEGYAPLIGYRNGISPKTGYDFIVHFCPFCGAKKAVDPENAEYAR